MTNDVMAKKFINVAENVLTRYVWAGWGQPLTDANKEMFINTYPENRQIKYGVNRADVIRATPSYYFAMDCNCGIKSVLDGFSGDLTKPYGGATYGKPCKDYTIQQMLDKECVDVSTDMSKILICEYIVSKDKGHCGIYVGRINGKRMVAEATYRFKDGFQLIDMDCPERKDMWGYHGKLWNFMDYSFKGDSLFTEVNPNVADNKKQLQACVKEMQALCTKMNNLIAKL